MSAFDERYAKLNADQKRAVDAVEGAVLVVAGPGSGKTEILALRVANILRKTDAGPTAVLCLTFTDSAASTMRARLASLIGSEAYRVQVGTFHSFAQLVARQYPAHFAGGADLVPAEATEQRELLAEAIRDLPIGDPIRSEGPTGELNYLGDAAARIGELKKAGIGPDAFDAILAHNAALLPRVTGILQPLVEGTVGKGKLKEYAQMAEALRLVPREPFPRASGRDLADALARSLEAAVMDAEAGDSSAPITAWKKAHVVPGEKLLRAAKHAPRLASLAKVYRRYRALLLESGLRDFDDLIVDLIEALRTGGELRAELQEQYLYVLVDEFQDTNDAQAELLALLADHPAAEGNPNLMVVGDDDQAIYRFHGAGLEHLLGFAEKYRQATVVTMATSYRSHQAILDLSQRHVGSVGERLEGRLPGLTKRLVQGGGPEASVIAALRAGSRSHERDAVASLIRQKLDAGVPPGEIAVIARRNRDLEALVPHLAEEGILVSYDRQRNALEDRHVIELVETARAASALAAGDAAAADPFLPRVLSYAFWGIPRLALWKLSRSAHAERKPWLDLALACDEPAIRAAAELLLDVGSRSQADPADQLVDELVGTCPTPEGRTSPFRAHHFGPAAREERPERLLSLVAALRGVLAAFRESRRGGESFLADLVRFADLRKEHGEPVPTRIAPGEGGVSLLTAHKAKGREFDVVVLLHAATDAWYGKGRGTRIAFPENLRLSPAGDSLDDQLRALFVAVTRARRELYLATSPSDSLRDTGEPLPLLGGLPEIAPAPARERAELSWAGRAEPATAGEKAALLPLVADYQLTPTQLNDFLDVIHGGPETFFERHLLRFPQHQSARMRFGNATHEALERIALEAKEQGLPDEERIRALLDEALRANRFHGRDLGLYLALGAKAITAYCAQRGDELLRATHVEVNFAKDRILVGDARVTGKADVIREEEDGIVIVDYKTGAGGSDWDEKRKEAPRHGNRRQLLFYVILAQRSARFAGKRVKEAKLAFVTPDAEGAVHDLSLEPEQSEIERVERLMQAVYRCATTLEFPDISRYPKDLSGIIAFEDDLLTAHAGKA